MVRVSINLEDFTPSRQGEAILVEKLKKGIRRNPYPSYHERERCCNPWNGSCEETDIALYIFYEGEKLPICQRCWQKIAAKDFEWSGKIGL